MSWRWSSVLAAAVVAISTFTVGTTVGSGEAEARRGGHRGGGARVARVYRPVAVYRPVRVRRLVRVYRPVTFAAVGPCHWLRVRAQQTGSPHWWRRWDACRRGY